MSVYKGHRRRTYQYDFWYAGRHYKGNTYQEDETDARLVESKHKLRLRQERGGIAEPGPSPSFSQWAGVYYAWVTKRQKPKRPERIDELLRVILRFWGARPANPRSPVQPRDGEEAPFHDLTLRDPIDDPTWILHFDEWMDRRGIAGGTRNHYNSRMSQLYYVALLPEYRKISGVTMNPFAGRPRERRVGRKVALTPALVMQWLDAMSYHTRLAVSIAALAPKLRLRNVLELRRDEHLDPELTTITVWDHKSDRHTGEPLITPVSGQLREILRDALGRNPGPHIVTYRGIPVESIRGGLRAAAEHVGIPYGRFKPGGVTFHTLRHTASTIFARLKVNPWLQRDAMGHQDLATTAGYTHLQLEEQRPVLEQLAAALPVAAIVTKAQRRAVRLKPASAAAGGPVGGWADGTPQFRAENRGLTRGGAFVPGRPFRRKASETGD